MILRASTCRSELTFDTVVPVNISQISMLDRKISSLAPSVLALEFIKIYNSKERIGIHCRPMVLFLLSFEPELNSLQNLLFEILISGYSNDQAVKRDFEL